MNATKCDTMLQTRTLTVVQLNAIDALASGKNDMDVAEAVGAHRTTISRWRLYHPEFIAELNRRRLEVWSNGADRLRAMIPEALEVLAAEMANAESPNRLKAAVEVLKLATPGTAIYGPMDADEVVRSIVDQRRESGRGTQRNSMLDTMNGLKSYDEHFADVEAELYAACAEAEVSGSPLTEELVVLSDEAIGTKPDISISRLRSAEVCPSLSRGLRAR